MLCSNHLQLTWEGLGQMYELPALNHLNVSGVKYKAEHAGSVLLPQLLGKLDALVLGDTCTLSFVDDSLLRLIASSAHALTLLDCSGCIDITDAGKLHGSMGRALWLQHHTMHLMAASMYGGSTGICMVQQQHGACHSGDGALLLSSWDRAATPSTPIMSVTPTACPGIPYTMVQQHKTPWKDGSNSSQQGSLLHQERHHPADAPHSKTTPPAPPPRRCG